MSPQAGWYADPTDPASVRWWDGAAWSAQTRPVPRELAMAGSATPSSPAAIPATSPGTSPVTSPVTSPGTTPWTSTAASTAPLAAAASTAAPVAPATAAAPAPVSPAPAAAATPVATPATIATPPAAAPARVETTPHLAVERTLPTRGTMAATPPPSVVVADSPEPATYPQAEIAPAAPATLAGTRRAARPDPRAKAETVALTSQGSTWTWSGTYGSRTDMTFYVASDVPLDLRDEAVRALGSRSAALSLMSTLATATVAGGGTIVMGTATEYASPVGGKTWCMPVTASGVSGGFCTWTNGKEWLQVLASPGVEQSAAKDSLAALAQLAKITTGKPAA